MPSLREHFSRSWRHCRAGWCSCYASRWPYGSAAWRPSSRRYHLPQPPLELARSLPLRPLRHDVPDARAAGARRFSGGALAPDAGPGHGERGDWGLSANGARAADWLRTPDWPAERGGRAGGEQAAGIFSRRRERGVKEEGNATQQADGVARRLELLRVRLPTSALGRLLPTEVRAPPAEEKGGGERGLGTGP